KARAAFAREQGCPRRAISPTTSSEAVGRGVNQARCVPLSWPVRTRDLTAGQVAVVHFRGTEPVALSRRAVELLRALLDRAGAPVSKDALNGGSVAWPCGRG